MNVNIEIKDCNNILNEFNDNFLSESFDHYLISSIEHKHFKTITLNINGNHPQNIEFIIKQYYKEKHLYLKKVDDIDNIIRLIMFILGTILIIISKHLNIILSEIFLIASWVIIWEIIYDILFNNPKRKRTKKIYKALAESTINYKNNLK